MAKKEELPNLEEIAKKLSSLEEDFKIPEIEPRVSEAYIKIAKYTDDKGRVRYKHDFSSEPEKVNELSDAIFDALSEHIHFLEFAMGPDQYNGIKDVKNPAGSRYADLPVQHSLGISREALRELLDGIKKNLTLANILGMVNKQVQERYIPLKQSEIDASLKDDHLEHIKQYITAKADEHKLPVYKDKIKDVYSLDKIKPVFRELAKEIYRK